MDRSLASTQNDAVSNKIVNDNTFGANAGRKIPFQKVSY